MDKLKGAINGVVFLALSLAMGCADQPRIVSDAGSESESAVSTYGSKNVSSKFSDKKARGRVRDSKTAALVCFVGGLNGEVDIRHGTTSEGKGMVRRSWMEFGDDFSKGVLQKMLLAFSEEFSAAWLQLRPIEEVAKNERYMELPDDKTVLSKLADAWNKSSAPEGGIWLAAPGSKYLKLPMSAATMGTRRGLKARMEAGGSPFANPFSLLTKKGRAEYTGSVYPDLAASLGVDLVIYVGNAVRYREGSMVIENVQIAMFDNESGTPVWMAEVTGGVTSGQSVGEGDLATVWDGLKEPYRFSIKALAKRFIQDREGP
jgi:hypothetical protein